MPQKPPELDATLQETDGPGETEMGSGRSGVESTSSNGAGDVAGNAQERPAVFRPVQPGDFEELEADVVVAENFDDAPEPRDEAELVEELDVEEIEELDDFEVVSDVGDAVDPEIEVSESAVVVEELADEVGGSEPVLLEPATREASHGRRPPTAAPPPPSPPPTPGERASTSGVPTEPAQAPAPPLESTLTRPDDVSVLDALLDGRTPADWHARARHLRDELEHATDPTRIGELSYELGEICHRRLADEAAAVKSYGRALQSDPSLRANLWAIRRVFYARKLWPNLVKLIGAEVRFATSSEERASLHVERAHIFEERLGDLADAQKSYQQAVGLVPNHIPALLGLERIARRTGEREELWAALSGLAAASHQPDRKAAVLLDLAREQRLAGREHVDSARATLTKVAELGVLGEALADERLALAEAGEDFVRAAAALDAKVAALMSQFGAVGPSDGEETAGAAQLRRRIIALRRRQAQLARRGEDLDAAWRYIEEAVALDPTSSLLLADLAELAERLGRYEDLADLALVRERGEADPERAFALSLKRVDALVRAGKEAESRELLLSLSQSRPGFLPLLAMREGQALRLGDLRQVALLQRELAEGARLGTLFGAVEGAAADARLAARHYTVAGDLARLADDGDLARDSYGQALECEPAQTEALLGMCALHVAAGRAREALALLRADGQAPDEQRLQLQAEVALIAGEPEVELEAIEGLRTLRGEDPELADRRLDLLYQLGRHEPLVEALVARAGEASDPDRAALLYFEAAWICEREARAPERAAALYREVLEFAPGDGLARSGLLEVLRQSGDWSAVASELVSRLDSLPDGPELVPLGLEAVELLSARLGRAADAAALAQKLLERVPDDERVFWLALSAAYDAGDFAVVASILESSLAREDLEREERRARLLELAGAALRQGHAQDAEHACREAAKLGSLAASILWWLLTTERGDSVEQAVATRALAENLGDGAERTALLTLAGWQSALGDAEDAAASAFEAALGGERKDASTLIGAALLAAKREQRGELGDLLGQLSQMVAGPYARSSLLVRSALLADVEGDERTARERLARAYAAAPQDVGTAVVCADRLGSVPPDPTENIDELLARAELCSIRAVVAGEGPARTDWELERAEALELGGRLAEAAQAVSSVLDHGADNIRALQALRRIARRGADARTLATASAALAEVLGDREGRLELLREAAAIFDGELSQVAAAVSVYRRIIEEEPYAPEYDRLVGILAEHDDVRSLYQVYSARLNQLDVDGRKRERAPILVARAVLRERIGDASGAVRDLRAALEIDADHLDAQFLCASLLARMGSAKEAAALYQSFLRLEADPGRRAEAELALSRILADNLDDIQGAIEQLGHVVRQNPRDIELRERLLALRTKNRDATGAADELLEIAKLRQTDGERARDMIRAAELLTGAAEAPRAVRILERARQLDSLNIDAIRGLVKIVGGDAKKADLVLEGAIGDVRSAIAERPDDSRLYERLAIVAGWRQDREVQWFALRAHALTGTPNAEQIKVLAELPAPSSSVGGSLSADTWRSSLVHRQATGFVGELWSILCDDVVEATDGSPQALGFARGDRVKAKDLGEFPTVASFARALELGELELYVSTSRQGVVRAISGEKPALCLGKDVADADTAVRRFALAQAMAHLRLGTGSVAELSSVELWAILSVAAAHAGVKLADAERAVQTALWGRLSKSLSRRARKQLPQLAGRFDELGEPNRWLEGVRCSAARTGLLAAVDSEAAFDVLDVGRGGRPIASAPVALDLLWWSVSEHHMVARKQWRGTDGQ